MAPAWDRARRALATRLCMRFAARRVVVEDAPTRMLGIEAPFPVAVVVAEEQQYQQQQPEDEWQASLAAVSPEPASELLESSRSGRQSSAKMCAICLGAMGPGQALFIAKCSHEFHFNCISSNVEHGNKACPMCRAVWEQLPALAASAAYGSARLNPSRWPQMSMLSINPLEDELSVFDNLEPAIFNDDEQIHPQPETAAAAGDGHPPLLEITTYAQFPALEESVAQDGFAISIHLKAPHVPAARVGTRAPLDLVTVLDVSSSMSGQKLALLKQAMGFVIGNLGPRDRLSVVAFSASAWRLFPIRRMTASGQQQLLHVVNSLVADGGTNIAEALRMAARVVEERQSRNPVCSIILLSDGVDARTIPARRPSGSGGDDAYAALVPRSLLPGSNHHVPIHAFGFGADHDSMAMHAVAQMSRGTFSYIDVAGSIQDAFAQCLGGLLSVVAQETRLRVDCCADQEGGGGGVLIQSIESGGYASGVDAGGRGGFVDVGRLYADEEMVFLVMVRVPPARGNGGSTALIRATCAYQDAVTFTTGTTVVRVVGGDPPVTLLRPAATIPVSAMVMCVQVERELHRIRATGDMAAAHAAAEAHDYPRAAAILEARRLLLESWCASLAADAQTRALVAELREMHGRVVSRELYEGPGGGRAYLLSGLSSHSWQRATARGGGGGDSTAELSGGGGGLLVPHAYQTPSMVDMLQRSQALQQPEVVVVPEALSRSASSRSPAPAAPAPGSPRPPRGLRGFMQGKCFTW